MQQVFLQYSVASKFYNMEGPQFGHVWKKLFMILEADLKYSNMKSIHLTFVTVNKDQIICLLN